MTEKSIRVLYVDDYPLDRALVRDALLSDKGAFELVVAASRQEFDSLMMIENFDLVLSDFNILGFTGLQVLDKVQECLPDTPVIIVTGTGSEEVAAEAIKRGAADYVIKSPSHIRRLPHIINNALEAQRLRYESQKAEQALRDSELRNRAIVSALPDMLFRIDSEFQYVDCQMTNPEKLLLSPEEYIGKTVREVLPPPLADLTEARVNQTLSSGNIQIFEYNLDQAGELRQLESRMVANGENEVLLIVRDITERKQAEEKLRIRSEELRLLTARIAETEQAERHRLSRELHDTVGQSLAVLSFNLYLIRDQMSEAGLEDKQSFVDNSISLVDDIIQSIRNVMDDLRPSVLDDYGLFTALSWYADRFTEQTNIKTQVTGQKLEPRLATNIENTLFRIAQEALTNVTRHANANSVKISLNEHGGNIEMVILDDGSGFEEINHLEKGQRRGWGLVNMRERADAVGGALNVETVVGQGVKIIIIIPRG